MSLRSKIKTISSTKESVKGHVPILKVPDYREPIKLTELDFDFENWPKKDLDVIYTDIEVSLFEAWEEHDLGTLSFELQNLIHACGFLVQVENGGILSFVDNECGEFFEETLSAFKTMDLSGASEILIQFKFFFDDEYVPKDMEERRIDFDVILERMNDENSPFASWDNYLSENQYLFKEKVIEYVRTFLTKQ